ncbi:hypothetical protein F5X68DRAFT_242137 [Plectosphaerella plurivora]|uniref:Wax synthase domain-containing protein n=1 Tax=Plectosphaerella plurivora TaxID=936078 RepID=A0A9P8V9T0_9PEZI|nr:hypothetical protein F5X68DRAFT_242137 [Plectosphaerella plurivora]
MVNQKHKPWVFALSVVNSYICLRSIADTRIDVEWFGNYIGDAPIDIIVKTCLLMALSIGVLHFLENHVQRPRDSFLGRVHEAYKQLTNGRRIGTDRMPPQMPVPVDYLEKTTIDETKKPGFEHSKLATTSDETPAELRGQKVGKSFHDRLGHIKSEGRLGFIIRRLSLVALLYVLEYVVKPRVIPLFITWTNEDWAAEKATFFRRLNDITGQDVKMRAYLAFETIWYPYSLYTMAHSFGSAVFVGLHLDEPHEWPPLFGDIKQAYSLRRYWVKFYDRLIYRTISGYGKLILRTLRLGGNGSQKDTAWQRWLLNGLLFFISGIIHAQSEYFGGERCGYWAEVGWWMLHFYGLVLELVAQSMLQRFCPKFYQRMANSWMGKVIGFTWVFAYLGWAAPKFSFISYSCNLKMHMAQMMARDA